MLTLARVRSGAIGSASLFLLLRGTCRPCRHELLLETNKLEVFADIAAWLDKQLAKQ